jgi:putative restriction endonuclease
MKQGQKLWTRDEILIAINLYHKLTFGQLDARNELVIEVAKKLGRTSNSLALKLVNLASLDTSLPRKGMSNYSKLDKQVWTEFYTEPEEVIFESEVLLNEILPDEKEFDLEDIKSKKTETQRTIISRVNQSFFRKSILASYENKCCISGLNISSMLIASHIIPWNIDEKNRLNPSNGLCLNALYDKAFDKGFITINTDYEIMISKSISNLESTKYLTETFINIHKTKIKMPQKFLPQKEFLEYHNDIIFQK